MGSQTRKKSPKGVFRQFRKQLREKSKDNKHIIRQNRRLILDKTMITAEREISEATLKRLHTLGSQKFGSSPFSDHFSRWLANVTAVLGEFEANMKMDIDDQFSIECAQTLAVIRLQLEEKSRQEASVELLMKNLAFCRNNLIQINIEYKTAVSKNKGQRNNEIKHLHNVINLLKKEQNKIVQTKTGFLHGISTRDREEREIAIVEELNIKQTELELLILNFNEHQKSLQDEYEGKKEPFLEQIRNLKKKIRILETDNSLEDRWFACEAYIDTINNFLQRKAAKTF